MAEKSPYLNVSDLTGGINDADSPFSIEPNQVTEAKNLDFRAGRIGTKRGGMEAISLTGSVFARAVPVLGVTQKGGFLANTTGTVSVPAYVNSVDATGNTYHGLLVYVTVNTSVAISSVLLGATNLTLVGQIALGAGFSGRTSIWYLANPTLAGGTLTVNLGAAADCAIIVQRWTAMDAAAGPTNLHTGGTTFGVALISFTDATLDSTYMGLTTSFLLPGGSTGIDYAIGETTDAQTSGGAVMTVDYKIAQKPTTGRTWLVSVPVNGAFGFVWAAIRGRLESAASTLGLTNSVRALIVHTPTNTQTDDELWAQDSFGRLDRYVNYVWQGGVNLVNSNVGVFGTGSYHTNGVSLHGKLFLALQGTTLSNRLHVWDGTVLRWAGLTANVSVNSVGNTGAGAYPATLRYYRVRWIEQNLRRSEPSASVSFTPSGAGTGALITRNTNVGTYAGTTLAGPIFFEGETHWEVEASTDNVLFYRIATVAAATTTYTDSALVATYASNPLSENIGEYVFPTAPRHVAVDQDRLMLGGDLFSLVNDSRVSWTPLRADTGLGNDERIPITARFFQDLDGLNGGNLTHLIPGMMGGMYAFKLQRIYKLIRTGSSARAYDIHIESASRGSLMRAGQLSSGINGAPVIYFVDPNVGLCGFTDQGVEDLMQTRRTIAARISKLPTSLNARMVVYSKHWIVWVWAALDAATIPNYGFAYNVRTRGWTDITGGFANVVAAVPCFTAIGETPYVAVSTPRTSYLCTSDTTTTDDGLSFRAWIVTKPMQLGQLYRKFGIQAAVLHAKASATTIGLALLRNLGLERKDVTTSIAASGTETHVVKPLDDARMSECQFVQFELGDPNTYAGAQLEQTWTLDELAAKLRSEDESTS